MQFSESWLRQYVNPPLDSSALAHAMTMAGLEVEEQYCVAPAFTKIVVAQICRQSNIPMPIVCVFARLMLALVKNCKLFVVRPMPVLA